MNKSVLFFGDFVCQKPEELFFSEDLQNLITSSEIACCNFEAPISGNGTPISKSGPVLTQSPNSPSFLEGKGFNLICMANNHMMDMGEEGCKATVNSFKRAHTIGVGSFNNAYQVKLMDTCNGVIGFLSLVQDEFGTLGINSIEDSYGTAWVNHQIVNKIIRDATKKCDYLIVLPHAGVENTLAPIPEWRRRYKEFVDLGAAAVIASHPHVPQGWEIYKNKPIFYSLGNFVFDSNGVTSHTDSLYKGLGVLLKFKKDEAVHFEVVNTKYIDGRVSLDETSSVKEYTCRLVELLNNDQEYYKYINQLVKKLWEKEYQLYLLRGLGAFSARASWNTLLHSAYGFLKGDDLQMLLNIFRCESHRWVIERYLSEAKK